MRRKLNSRDLALGAADIADIFRNGAIHLRIGTLQIQHAVACHITFLGQVAQVVQLVLQNFLLRLLVDQRLLKTVQLRFQSRDIFFDGANSFCMRCLARRKQLALQADLGRDTRIVLALSRSGGKATVFLPSRSAVRRASAARAVKYSHAAHFRIGLGLHISSCAPAPALPSRRRLP